MTAEFKINVNYTGEDFDADEMKALEELIRKAFIYKENSKEIGITFIFKGVLFSLDTIIYDFDTDIKFLNIRQLMKRKRIIEPAKGVFIN